MAQCIAHVYWWQNLHRHLQAPLFSRSKTYSHKTFWEEVMGVSDPSEQESSRLVVCFRDDDGPSVPEFVDRDLLNEFGVKTSLHVRYSPWAVDMINGLGSSNQHKKIKESNGGPFGGGRGRGDDGDDGDGGGGGGGEGGDGEGGEYVFLLPVLTLAFAAFHLGYCIAVWVKDDKLNVGFFRTGLGLFVLLALTAVRLNSGAGIDAYVLGLGASLGVMAWTGERCLVKKEGSPAGIVALFAASMAVMFTAALYHNM